MTKKISKKIVKKAKLSDKENKSKKDAVLNVSIENQKAKTLPSKKNIQQDNIDKVLITKDGLQKLREELSYLKDTKRKEVAKRLQEAISYGDLSENAEYEEAKNEQAFCEGRIAELEKMIKNASLIDENQANKTQTVRIGTTVIIKNLSKQEDPMEFTIVGSTEADPFASRISNESPIGKNLIGKQKGDKFKVDAPGGTFEFELVKVN